MLRPARSMRSLRPTLARPALNLRLRRALARAAEVAAWALALILLEAVGRAVPPGEVVDLAVLVCVVAPLAALATVGVRRGRLPLTRRAAGALALALKRTAKRLDPGYHLALTLPPGAAVPDRPLVGLLLALALTTVCAVVAGPRLLELLGSLRSLAYAPYLLLVSLLWALSLAVVAAALALEAQSTAADPAGGRVGPGPAGRSAPAGGRAAGRRAAAGAVAGRAPVAPPARAVRLLPA